MSFDAIPEDKQQSFPCEECGTGNIVKDKEGDWECDTCPAIHKARRPAASSLPECPKCGERYCGDGVALCIECANASPTTN